jgi:hypothetical protein
LYSSFWSRCFTKNLFSIARKYTWGQIWEDFLYAKEEVILTEQCLDRCLKSLRNGTRDTGDSGKVKMVKR